MLRGQGGTNDAPTWTRKTFPMYPVERLEKTAVDFMGEFLILGTCPEWRCSLNCEQWLGGPYNPAESKAAVPATASLFLNLSAAGRRLRVETEQPHPYTQESERCLVGDRTAASAGERANRNAATSLPVPHHALHFESSQGLMSPYESVRRCQEPASSVRSRVSGQRGDSSGLTGLGISLSRADSSLGDLAHKKEFCLE